MTSQQALQCVQKMDECVMRIVELLVKRCIEDITDIASSEEVNELDVSYAHVVAEAGYAAHVDLTWNDLRKSIMRMAVILDKEEADDER